MNHKERMVLMIQEVCKKYGEDISNLKSRRVYGSFPKVKAARIHRELEIISPAFLTMSQQADLLDIPLETIISRVYAL